MKCHTLAREPDPLTKRCQASKNVEWHPKEPMMKLSYVVLLASDVPAAVRFWRDVMEFPLTYSDETIGYAAFDTGGAGLALALFSRDGVAAVLGEATRVPPPQGRQTHRAFLGV